MSGRSIKAVKVLLPVLAGLAVITAGIWFHRRLIVFFPVPVMGLVPPDDDDDVDEAHRALALIIQSGLKNESFARAWQDAVRGTADQMTARIVGARMAGRIGIIQLRYGVPIPPDVDSQTAKTAFILAVQTEVARRVDAMPRPGGFG